MVSRIFGKTDSEKLGSVLILTMCCGMVDKYTTAEKYAWCVLGPKLGHQFVSTQVTLSTFDLCPCSSESVVARVQQCPDPQILVYQTVIDVPEELRPSHDLGYKGFLFDDATLFRPAGKMTPATF